MKTDESAHADLIEELAAAAEGLLVSLRLNEGIPDEKLNRLVSALSQAGEQWRGSQDVPKRLAAILLEIYPAVEAASHLYEDEEAESIQQAAAEIFEEAIRCLQ